MNHPKSFLYSGYKPNTRPVDGLAPPSEVDLSMTGRRLRDMIAAFEAFEACEACSTHFAAAWIIATELGQDPPAARIPWRRGHLDVLQLGQIFPVVHAPKEGEAPRNGVAY